MLASNKLSLCYFVGFLINLPIVPAVLGIEFSGVSFIYVIALLLLVAKAVVVRSPIHLSLIGISLFLCFIISYVLAFYVTDITEYGNYKFIFFFGKCVTLFAVGILISNDMYGFFKGYLHSIVIVSMLALTQFYIHAVMSGLGFSVNNRLEIGTVNPIWLSRLLTEAFLCVLIFYGIKKYLAVAFFIGLPSVLLSGSKGPILALFVAMFYRLKKIDKYKLIFGSVVFLVSLFVLINTFATTEVQEFFQQRFLRVVPDAVSNEDIANSRGAIWERSLLLIFSDTSLFFQGIGVGNSYVVVSEIPIRFYPHNIFIEIFLENGVISFILFTVTVLCALLRARNAYWMPLFLLSFVNALFSGDVIQNEKLFLFAGLSFSSAIYARWYMRYSKASNVNF